MSLKTPPPRRSMTMVMANTSPESAVKDEKPKNDPVSKKMVETPKKKSTSSKNKNNNRAKGKLTDGKKMDEKKKKKTTKKIKKKTEKMDENKKIACDMCKKQRRAIDMVFTERMGIKEVMCKTCNGGSSSS